MGWTKTKLFGAPAPRWPRLSKLVENGELLPIDLAYAEKMATIEEEAAIHCGLLLALRKGHLCLDLSHLDEFPPLFQQLIQKGANGKTRFSLPKSRHFEEKIIDNLRRLLNLSHEPLTCTPAPDLNDEQQEALRKSLTNPFCLITGGPGTGKTYTASQIVEAFRSHGKTNILLTAPTGKAAAHLSTITQTEGKTLHRLLQVRGPLDYLQEPEPLEADLVIVDEASMIDPPLFARLLAAIGPGTTLILMGDKNQLPAVQGGSLFADLLDTKIPSTTLQTCMRSDRTEILDLAQSILTGASGDIRTLDLGFGESDLEKIYQNLWNYAKKHAPTNWQEAPNSFRILSTLRKGPLGVDALNRYLFEQFSASQAPILITRNDPRTGLTNGETGVLIDSKIAHFAGKDPLPIDQLPPFEYAYCLSVHKSQGSEYDHVLLLVPEGSEAFGREVIYTAVTRAKTHVDIDGNPGVIAEALAKVSGKVSSLASL